MGKEGVNMFVAKIDFNYRGIEFKSGDEVRVSESIADTLQEEGKIEPKTEKTEKTEKKEK